jgi:hypothetical protein
MNRPAGRLDSDAERFDLSAGSAVELRSTQSGRGR